MARPEVHAASPALGWYTDALLYHRIWNRAGLSKRDRSLVTVAALISRGHMTQLKGHINRALSNGVRPVEIVEIVAHLAFFAGWPNAMSSVAVMDTVFRDAGIDLEGLGQALGDASSADAIVAAGVVTPGEPGAGLFASTLGVCTDRVVSGLWRRTELSARDRSLATISALVAGGQLRDLVTYARRGVDGGLELTELSEAVAHLAFYVGVANASGAADLLDAAFPSTNPPT